jgi:hypothetical protein
MKLISASEKSSLNSILNQGRAPALKQKPDGSLAEESSKQKADKSESDNSSVNDNPDENPRKIGPPDLSPALKQMPNRSSAEASSA